MMTRLLVTTLGIPIILCTVWIGSPWISIFVLLIGVLGSIEFYRMVRLWGFKAYYVPGIMSICLYVWNGHNNLGLAFWIFIVSILLTVSWKVLVRLVNVFLSSPNDQWTGKREFLEIVYSALGSLYLGWGLSLAIVIRQEDKGTEWLILAIIGTFATDTGSYGFGRLFGKRQMAPYISPNKTWEGAFGGVITGLPSVLIAVSAFQLPIPSITIAIILGFLVSILAQIGDLIESFMKRKANLKDSGSLIPGHGGILDRLDSVVLVLLVVYHFNLWVIN
jgi:phosphatidate cytidylyltransferase